LRSRKAYLEEPQNPYLVSGVKQEAQLLCDGCIPLFRKYGQPLLVVIKWREGVKKKEYSSKGKRQSEFKAAVKLINLYWQQLQGHNQRQWSLEHEEWSGALRGDVFLEQGQSRIQSCQRRDEPFALVVLTLKGFRRMFAGHSQQWRSMSGLVGQSLSRILQKREREFLLGRTADDVFVFLLSRTDEFLAGNIMLAAAKELDKEISGHGLTKSLDVMAIDMQWIVEGSKHYEGDLGVMLDKMYRRLFCQGQDKQNVSYQILLKDNVEELQYASDN